MKTSKLATVALVTVLTTVGLASLEGVAADKVTPRRPLRAHMLERARERLDLTDEQVAQIKSVLKSDKDTVKDLLTRLREARNGLREAIRAADASEGSVRAAAAKVAAIEADVAVQRMKMRARINPILTEEQREKINRFQSRFDGFRRGRVDRIGGRLAE